MPNFNTEKFARSAWSILALTALMSPPALAGDWGYDDPAESAPAQVEPASAAQSPARAARPAIKGKKGTVQQRRPSGAINQSRAAASNETSLTPQATASEPPPAPKGPTVEEIAARKKVDDLKSWMEIFALAASSATEDDRNNILNLGTLPPETRKRLEQLAFEKLEQNVPEYCGVTAVWQPLRQKVSEDLDYKESYRLLFRALLRHAVSRIEPTAAEAEAIQEVLGPARIAEVGPPILTEDAINAYGDMTCFTYQKRHPDHTVDGDENRQLFADVIRQRYNDAPNIEAKKAMCNFDVTWASFRCRYLDANPAERDKLMATIDKSGDAEKPAPRPKPGAVKAKSPTTISIMSPKLLKLFSFGPWAESSKTIPVAVKMNQMSSPTK